MHSSVLQVEIYNDRGSKFHSRGVGGGGGRKMADVSHQDKIVGFDDKFLSRGKEETQLKRFSHPKIRRLWSSRMYLRLYLRTLSKTSGRPHVTHHVTQTPCVNQTNGHAHRRLPYLGYFRLIICRNLTLYRGRGDGDWGIRV